MQKNTYFTAILFAVGAGIFLMYLCENRTLSLLLLLLSVFLLFPFFHFFGKKLGSTLFMCLFFPAFLGILYSSVFYNSTQENLLFLGQYQGLYLNYEGKIEGIHSRSDFYDEYRMSLQKINKISLDRDIMHILRIPKNFRMELGQEISYQGKMYFFEDFNGFSYQKFMLSKNLYFSTSTLKIDTFSYNKNTLSYHMYQWREKLLANIARIFPPQEAIFLGGILFGARENIPQDLKEDFNNSGLTHFIAVSGFNITLCIIFTTFLFAFLPVWGRIIMVSVTIVSFSVFVGLGAPVVRAAIMGIIGYIIMQQGSTAKSITLLLFTLVCMALYSPASLLYDVSLHLSFLAVMGIIYTQEYFKKIFFWVPKTFAVQEACVLTLSALSFALPVMMFQFGQVSLLAPFANIAVTWTIPLAMLAGTLTLLVDFVSPFLGQIVGFFTWILLHYDILMVRFFGNLEFALWQIDAGVYANYLQILYFIVLTYILSYLHFRTKKQPF